MRCAATVRRPARAMVRKACKSFQLKSDMGFVHKSFPTLRISLQKHRFYLQGWAVCNKRAGLPALPDLRIYAQTTFQFSHWIAEMLVLSLLPAVGTVAFLVSKRHISCPTQKTNTETTSCRSSLN